MYNHVDSSAYMMFVEVQLQLWVILRVIAIINKAGSYAIHICCLVYMLVATSGSNEIHSIKK